MTAKWHIRMLDRIEHMLGSQYGARLRRAAEVGGTILFAVSLVLIAVFVAKNWQEAKSALAVNHAATMAAAAFYAITLVSSSFAWIFGLHAMGIRLPAKTGLAVNLLAQANKYLPGNIFHLMARAVIARRRGVAVVETGLATVIEVAATALACFSTVAICLAAEPAILGGIADQSSLNIAYRPLIAGLAILLVSSLFFIAWFSKRSPRAIMLSIGAMLVSFFFAGLSFWSVSSGIAGASVQPVEAIALFAVAWMVGFLVPGAPAGVGIRESILLLWLTPQIGAGEALAVTLLHRVLTAMLDLAASLAAFVWLKYDVEELAP